MNKIYKIVLGIIFLSNPIILFAQINVNIVGSECNPLSGVYNYVDLFNGKNRYSKDFVIQGNAITMQH